MIKSSPNEVEFVFIFIGRISPIHSLYFYEDLTKKKKKNIEIEIFITKWLITETPNLFWK